MLGIHRRTRCVVMAHVDIKDRTTGRVRRYKFYDSATGTSLEISDEAGPFLAWAAKNVPTALNSALGSAGYFLRKDLVDAIYRGQAGSVTWKRLSDVHRYGKITDLKDRTPTPRTWAYGRLVRAVAYHRDKARMRVRVGWLSRSAARLGVILQSGRRDGAALSGRQRRLFWAAGSHLSRGKSRLNIPGRPLMEPVWQAKRPAILRFIEQRTWKKMGMGKTFGWRG